MRVLLINGSPHKDGSTALALNEVTKTLNEAGVETEIFNIENQVVRGCIACRTCKKTGKCIFEDSVNLLSEKLKHADGLVIGTPVYYANPNGTLLSLLERLFYSYPEDLSFKVGAAITSARRAGNTSTFDAINKFFTIANMPIVSSQYWNNIHGNNKEEASKDLEGLQTMRTLAKNMTFLMKAIKDAKEKYGLPEKEEHIYTNFSHGK